VSIDYANSCNSSVYFDVVYLGYIVVCSYCSSKVNYSGAEVRRLSLPCSRGHRLGTSHYPRFK